MILPFKPGDRVRLDSWAPSEALDNLGVQEEPPPGAEGWVISVTDLSASGCSTPLGRTTHQIDVWWDDRGARGGHKSGRSVHVCHPGDRLTVCGQPHPMIGKVTQLDDTELDNELAFARSLNHNRGDLEGTLWQPALEYEKETR